MSLSKPYRRCVRKQVPGNNSGYSSWAYIVDHDYSTNPVHYLRAYRIIQRDIISLFEYIEPADINSNTYSFKIYDLYLRVCTEIEANFKAILKDNTFNPTKRNGSALAEKYWNITHYKNINKSHHLQDMKSLSQFGMGLIISVSLLKSGIIYLYYLGIKLIIV